MADPQAIIMIVKFRSRLSEDELTERYRERLPQFQALEGLTQKYYVQDAQTGEWGGVYVWDSKASLDAYRESELRKTIAAVYEVEGAPSIQVLAVRDLLRT